MCRELVVGSLNTPCLSSARSNCLHQLHTHAHTHTLRAVASRSFTYVSVAGLLALYVGYVVVVAVTDVSKRMGVEWAEVAARVAGRLPSQLWRGGGGGFGGRRGELGTPLLERRGFDEGGGGATGRVMEAGEALPQSTDAVPPRCVRCVWDRA